MDNIQNTLKKNNLKLKIKNLSDLQSPNITFRGFPTLKINSTKKYNLNGKFHLDKSIKRNSISNDKNIKIEKLNNENQILRKKIELLEEENKRLREENNELKNKKDEELFNSSIKNDNFQNTKEKIIKFKTLNSQPIKFNSGVIINIRKATLLNDFTNSLPNEHAYTISNNVDSPKISNNNSKLIKLSTYSISHRNQNSNLINSLDSGFDMKLHLNNIKKRIKLLFDKYSKIIE